MTHTGQGTINVNKEHLSFIQTIVKNEVFDWDIRTDKIEFNPRYSIFTNHNPDKNPKTFKEYCQELHPDKIDAFQNQLKQYFSGETDHFCIESQIRHSVKGYIFVQIDIKITEVDETKKPLLAIGVITDISKQKLAEKKLHTQEETIKTIIFETAKCKGQEYFEKMVQVQNKTLNADYTFIGLLQENDIVTTIAVCHKGKIIPDLSYNLKNSPCENVINYYSCVYPKNICNIFPDDQLLVDMGIEAYVGTPLWSKNDEGIGIIVSLFKKEIKDTKFISSLFELFAPNISSELERIETDKHLKESEEKFRVFMENIPASIYIKDKQNKLLFANANAQKFLQQKNILLKESIKLIDTADIKILKTDIPQVELNYGINVNGENRWIKDIKFPITIINNQKVVAGIALDTTDIKNYQSELEMHQTKLEELIDERTTELQAANEELQSINDEVHEQKKELEVTLHQLKNTQTHLIQSEKMASLGTLVAGVAHEINNPINFISASVGGLKENLQLLQKTLKQYQSLTKENFDVISKGIQDNEEKYPTPETLEIAFDGIDCIEMGVNRTVNLVTSLRTFARTDEDNVREFNIHDNINDTLIILHNLYKGRIDIIKEFGNIEIIECYPGLINQVIMNIISNAVQAIPNKGTITITTKRHNDSHLFLSIKDTGAGISDEVKLKIFDPFFTTKKVGEGTGLGLSIAYTNVVQKHKGEILVNSKENEGTEFKILLPIKFQSESIN